MKLPLFVVPLLVTLAAHADTVTVSRQVLLANAQPAAGATVLIRTFDEVNGRLVQEVRLTTDPNGRFAANVEVPPYARDGRPPLKGVSPDYVLVDAPGAPLAVIELKLWRQKQPAATQPLRLQGGAVLFGKVLHENQPVAEAQVELAYVSGLRLNDSAWGAVSPQAGVKTNADGTYTTRPLILEGNTYADENGYVMVSATAKAQRGPLPLRGAASNQVLVPANAAPERRGQPINIFMGGTWTAKGKITNELTRQPVVGAQIEIVAHSVWPIDTALTNAKGEWQINGIPPGFETWAVASHPKMTLNAKQIGQSINTLGPEEMKPKTFESIDFELRPQATLTGRVVDETTGKAPELVRPDLNLPWEVVAFYSEGQTSRYGTLARGRLSAPLPPDGNFTLPVAQGANRILAGIPNYEMVERIQRIEAPLGGLKDVVINVRRRPMFLLRFEGEKPDDLKNVEVLVEQPGSPNGSSTGSIGTQGWWSTLAQRWGEVKKIQVMRGYNRDRKEVVPWMTITATPGPPQIIKIPPIQP